MNTKLHLTLSGSLLSLSLLSTSAVALTPFEQLGEHLYFDENLSDPNGQACASCHLPETGFAEPGQNLPVSEGVIPGRFGGRNAPTSSYAVFFPPFELKGNTGIGGQFWDGRASTLADQAKGPFLNPVEMNNLKPGEPIHVGKARVLDDILASGYQNLFVQECGNVDLNDPASIDAAYDCLADAIAAFESTTALSPFTSKFDAVMAGTAQFTAQGEMGFDLFRGKAKCAHCHSNRTPEGAPAAIFTDNNYHNLGLPVNPVIAALIGVPQPVDLGLGGVHDDPRLYGSFKTSHLRNIAMTPPYMHNGVLKTLTEVVDFYNTRDIPGMWDEPEVPDNLDSKFLGDLKLTAEEVAAIVAFMETLTDGYTN